MFSGSIIVIATLVVFSLQESLAQSSSVNTSSTTISMGNSTTAVPSTASYQTPPVTPTPTTGAPPVKKTCGNLSVVITEPNWSASYADKNSAQFQALELMIKNSTKSLYNDSNKYSNLEVSDLLIKEKGGNVQVWMKLCLIVKTSGAQNIQDVFLANVNIGRIVMLKVDKESGAFEWIGVKLSGWKAKEGECDKCSDGGGGPIVIEGKCVPETGHSCDYVKKTKETKECLTYCDSSVTTKISSLILAIGMLLSVSFNIWK